MAADVANSIRLKGKKKPVSILIELHTLLITKVPETYTQLSVSDAIVVTPRFYDTSRGQLKCDDTRVETIFRLSAKRNESI